MKGTIPSVKMPVIERKGEALTLNATQLLHAAFHGNVEHLRRTVQLGADANARDEDGVIALQLAISRQKLPAKYRGKFLRN